MFFNFLTNQFKKLKANNFFNNVIYIVINFESHLLEDKQLLDEVHEHEGYFYNLLCLEILSWTNRRVYSEYYQKVVKSNPSTSKLPPLGPWLKSLNCSVVSSPTRKMNRVIAMSKQATILFLFYYTYYSLFAWLLKVHFRLLNHD